jgi:hypothetical protein
VLAALHPHHVGAEIGQQTGAERPSQHMGEVEDAYTVEWWSRHSKRQAA